MLSAIFGLISLYLLNKYIKFLSAYSWKVGTLSGLVLFFGFLSFGTAMCLGDDSMGIVKTSEGITISFIVESFLFGICIFFTCKAVIAEKRKKENIKTTDVDL